MTHYVIRVAGQLSDDLLTAFPHLLADEQPLQTLLHGQLPDQAALTGVLNHLDELGVEIVEVLLVPPLLEPAAHGGRASQ